MKYRINATIEFDGERHCLRCPLRGQDDDDCVVRDGFFETWEEQMKDCPLVEEHLEMPEVER